MVDCVDYAYNFACNKKDHQLAWVKLETPQHQYGSGSAVCEISTHIRLIMPSSLHIIHIVFDLQAKKP